MEPLAAEPVLYGSIARVRLHARATGSQPSRLVVNLQGLGTVEDFRRRQRGGGASGAAPGRAANGSLVQYFEKPSEVADLMAEVQLTETEANQKADITADPLEDMDDYFELYEMQDLVVVHAYDGDQDEHILEEVKPRYIIMYEPNQDFIRRIEVYRSNNPGIALRVYFMLYQSSSEEHKYLAGLRKEKEAFEHLIKERGVRLSRHSTTTG